MRRLILFLLILVPLVNWAQPYSITWDGATNVSPWVELKNIFNVTPQRVCQGSHSLRVALRGNQALGTAQLRSPLLFTATGGEITMSFDYKWLIYDANIGSNPPVASNGNQLSMKLEWSNATTGPWIPFYTIDATNHVIDANCKTVTTTFAPKPGPLYVRITAANTTVNANPDNFLYLDNIFVDQGPTPTCIIPDEIFVTNKSFDSFTINWVPAENQTTPNYSWEVRTSGLPGSGPNGLHLASTPPFPGTSAPITGLIPNTVYYIYVRSECSTTDSSFWTGIEVLTNCQPPAFTAPKDLVCGIREHTMVVTSTGGATSLWYDVDGNLVLANSNRMVIPEVTESLSFKVYNGIYDNFADVIQLGTGINSVTDGSPFGNTKSQKVQYIYLASELQALGFTRGIVKSFGFKVGLTSGTAQRDNFTIHMGETPLEEFPANNKFIPTVRLTQVKSPGNQLLVANSVNMFELDNAFEWDGVSNIVVQFTYANPTAATAPTATPHIVSSFSPAANRVLFVKNDTNDYSTITGALTGTRAALRMNGYFDVIAGCFGEPQIAELTFKPAPTFTLTSDVVNNCAGTSLTKLYVLTGAGDFNSYEWTITDPTHPAFNDNTHPDHPDNAISGDEKVGWTFTTTGPMEYNLKASSTTGDRCVVNKVITVQNNPNPQLLQLLNDYSLCTNDVQELKIDNFTNESPNRSQFNGSVSGATISNVVAGDAIVNETTMFSEGTGSLKVTHAAQTNAIVSLGTPVNMLNLKTVVVEFDHIAALQASATAVMDYAYLEYSTNNGTTWKPFVPADYTGSASQTITRPTTNTNIQAMYFTSTSYADWSGITQSSVPTSTAWKTERFQVPASEITGAGTFKVRFRIGADGSTQFPGWFIDNVKIIPVNNHQYVWTPIANLYYDQAATVPYDGSINAGTVYFKGTSNSLNVPYKVEVTNQFGCKAEKNFKISVGLKEAPVVTNLDRCGTIDVSTTNFGKNPNGTLTYYAGLTASAPITQITTSGVYYVEQEISGCKSARVPFTVVINPIAPVPTAAVQQNFCGTATVNDLVYNPVQGFQINWYLTSTGGAPLATGAPINNGVYYGEFTNGVCISPSRVAVNVNVGIKPLAISMANVYICGISTIADIKVASTPGAIVNWYQNINDVTPLVNTTVLTTGTYYIAQKINNCESTRTAVAVSTVTNLTLPTATTVQTFCASATVGDLVASANAAGANIYWYGFSTSDTPLANTTPLTSGTYYVGQSIGDCDSPKRAVSVRILSVNAPFIAPINICGDATVSSLPLNPTALITYKVYNSSFATVEMGQNDPITTGTYYISAVENGCETARAVVYITVTARPNAPTGNINQMFEDYAEVKDLKANEANVIWFDSYNDAVNNVNPLPSSTPLQEGKTYYGILVGTANCGSLPMAVTIKITLGTNDLDLASLKYYPNPTDSELTISYKEVIKSVEVYDVLGKQIQRLNFDANEVRLNLSNLSSGTYMVKVFTTNGSQFIKIVKK